MNSRLDLHNLLLSIGGPNVYYQVPSNITMKYPAIKYEKTGIDNDHANDLVYHQTISYTITIMSKIVDDPIIDTISKLPRCKYDRSYVVDGIYHTIFNINY
jgi:hypothetical protein